MIEFPCPNRSVRIKVRDELGGRAATCPKCKGKLTIPTGDDGFEVVDDEEPRVPVAKGRRPVREVEEEPDDIEEDERPARPRRVKRRPSSADIPTYLAQSIIVTLLCCWPFGIPAIIFAAKVNGRLASGDVRGARDASAQAKMWCWISFGSGLAVTVIYVVVVVIGAAAGGLR